MPDFQPLTGCLACGGTDLTRYLDLGSQPLANAFHAGGEQPRYPLAVNVCGACFHSQLSIAVDPAILYKNYPYASGTSATLRKYFSDFAESVAPSGPGVRDVLEIASNDGSLLGEFKLRGHNVVGVEPAVNLAALNKAKGIPVIAEFWPLKTDTIDKKFDIIVAMNVIAHVADPLAFLVACKQYLKPGGRIYLQTSQAFMVEGCEWDTVYHEHLSYFCKSSWSALAERADLKIHSGKIKEIHGRSWLIEMAGGKGPESLVGHASHPSESTYRVFQSRVDRHARTARAVAGKFPQLVGYGAAAKGMTFLNYTGIAPMFIVDDGPLKVGRLTPGQNIPVMPTSALLSLPAQSMILITAWNFREEIMARVRAIRPHKDDMFMTFFPDGARVE